MNIFDRLLRHGVPRIESQSTQRATLLADRLSSLFTPLFQTIMKTAIAFVALMAVVAAAAATPSNSTLLGSWSDCGESSWHATNLKVTIDPPNPQPGDSYTYTSDYDLDETVTGGQEHVQITLRGIPVSTKTDDLCTALKDTDTPCPIAAGHVHSVTKGTVPANTPSGALTATAKWTDQNNEPVLCIQLTFNIN